MQSTMQQQRALSAKPATRSAGGRTQSMRVQAVFKSTKSTTTSGRKTLNGTENSKFVRNETVDYVAQMPGVSAPFDAPYFDPAGFAAKASIADVRRWREAELTHGRVSMLAAVGFIVGEQLEDWPAFFNYDGSVTGPAITHFSQIRQGFWEPLLISIGLAESWRVAIGWATPTGTGFNALKDEYTPGDLMFDPLGLKPEDPEELKVLQTKELNNGRLAMIAIAAFVVQECVEQTEIFEHLALRFEREVVLELDDIERDLGLPVTPLPEIVVEKLGAK